MGTGSECRNNDLDVRRGTMPRPFPSYFFGQHGPLGQHCIVKTQHFGPRAWLASCAEAWVPRKRSAPNQQNPPAVVPSSNATTKIAFANMTASRLWGESILDGHGEKRNPATPPLTDHSAGRSRDNPSRLLSAQRIWPLTQSSTRFNESNLAAQDLKDFEETVGSKELERDGWVCGCVADLCFEGECEIGLKGE